MGFHCRILYVRINTEFFKMIYIEPNGPFFAIYILIGYVDYDSRINYDCSAIRTNSKARDILKNETGLYSTILFLIASYLCSFL